MYRVRCNFNVCAREIETEISVEIFIVPDDEKKKRKRKNDEKTEGTTENAKLRRNKQSTCIDTNVSKLQACIYINRIL